jgi:hypothetical protein
MKKLNPSWTWACLVFIAFSLGLSQELPGQSLAEAMKFLDVARYQPEVYLPYKADQVREQALGANMNSLESGYSTEAVLKTLGAPDEVEPIMVAGDRTEELQGFTYIYLWEREKSDEWGKPYNEKAIRVYFDLSGRLVSAEGYAVPGFHEVVRELGLAFEFTMGLHETVKINDLLIRLDFVLNGEGPSAGESGASETETSPSALFSLTMPDRKDNIELSMEGAEEQSKTYSRYRITLLAIPNSDRVSLIVK